MMMMILSFMFLIPFVYMVNFWFISFIFLLSTLMFMFKLGFSLEVLYISYFLGVDLLSYTLILLSIWICFLMILASQVLYNLKYFNNLFILIILLLMISLFVTFSSLNMFIFYLFFEISLIPIFVLVLGWGYQPERITAGVYLLFYTLLVSLPVMVALFYLNVKFYSLEFYFFNKSSDLLLYLVMNMIFFVKIPMYFTHLWLPKAHVEAPISGSMVLAGVMLKLGGYGLFRVMKLFVSLGVQFNILFIIISLMGGVYISVMCLRQSDMKMLIAYSSVSHMGLVLSGILTMNLWGYWGALVLMLAHGLSSSGLFCLVNLFYERTFSRSFYLNKGFINILPSVSLWMFLLCISNMAAPPSLNLLGEILLINSLVLYSKYFMVILFILIILSAAYSLFLYSFTQHGKMYSGVYSFSLITVREFLLLALHWVPLNFLFLKSDTLLLWV
uniref:NADH-ubiquinone oxidoreductase chain 4 n=1 Tax=Hylastes attenuatus TaxID=471226 RepID=A0A343A6J2_9CUCU|nr:NADH dehydrogenase subunit 4 [Hylastes attenuatus]AOY40184.1 NADH dehydrogenase subunit 4 [Hylastes attenuatus]